ncbi:unnamed protein product [Allacma fusca]|uniref:GH18 domain-containing protein n=1 Tax=Allacma fusca TaxID=39272 RepID=A0A8J2LMM8_9HEXA|nr:unnamed protein product [Allacma fusca]
MTVIAQRTAQAQVGKTNEEIIEDLLLSQAQPKAGPEQYLRYTKGLVFAGNDFRIDPDPFPCTDLDPEKEFAIFINEGKDAIRVCDLCPNLPLEKLVSLTFIPEFPESLFKVSHNSLYPDCVVSCIETPDCLATNYDSLQKTCSFFNSTRGELKSTSNSTYITPYQPTGIIRDWVYNCLAACDANSAECRYASYSFEEQECTLIRNLTEGNYEVIYEYGYLSAFKQDVIFSSSGTKNGWRFQRVGATIEDMANIDENDLFNELISNQNSSTGKEYDYVDNLGCKLQPMPGCDQYTAKQKCRYPENLPENVDKELPLCPGSRDAVYKSLQKLSEAKEVCQSSCSNAENCIGITWKVDKQQLDSPECTLVTYKTLTEQLQNLDDKEFYSLTTPQNHSLGFSIYPKLQIDSSFGTATTRVLNDIPDAESCRDNCNFSPKECQQASYNIADKTCILSKGEARFTDSAKSILLVRPPTVNATAIAYTRLIGVVFTGEALDVHKRDSTYDSLPENVDKCLQYCISYQNQNRTCDFVSVKMDQKYGTEVTLECSYYDAGTGSVETLAGSQVYVKTGQSMDFSQLELNKVSILQGKDSAGCFRKEPTNPFKYLEDFADDLDQAETKTEPNETPTKILSRRKRGVGSIFQGIAGVVSSFIKNGKPFITGMKVPIVSDAINTGISLFEVAVALSSGPWSQVVGAVLDLGLNAIGLIPIPAAKFGAQALIALMSYMKTDILSAMNKIVKPKKDNDAASNQNEDDSCEQNSRRKRATAVNSNKRPRDCDDFCRAETVNKTTEDRIYMPETTCLVSQEKSGQGFTFQENEQCVLICSAGYNENDPMPTCKKDRNSNDYSFSPAPACSPQSCGDGHTFTVSAMPSALPGFAEKRIGIYYVKYDKTKKLPIYSASILDKYNFRYSGGPRRDAFKKHPCPQLQNDQHSYNDYTNTGWVRGHLTPDAAVAPLGVVPQKSTYLFVNIAPQNGWLNSGQWSQIERAVQCFTKKYSGLVITGICPGGVPSPIPDTLEHVPSCFWKLVCYKSPDSGRTIVTGFIGDNSIPSDSEKEARKKEIRKIRTQAEVRDTVGLTNSEVTDMWENSYSALIEHRDPRISPSDCANSNEANVKWWEDAKKGKTKMSTLEDEEYFGCSDDDLLEFRSLIEPIDDDDSSDGEEDEGSDENDSIGAETFRSSSCGKRLIGYYPSWGTASFTNVQGKSLTHAVFAFFETFADGSVRLGSADANNSPDYGSDVDISKKRLANFLRIQETFSHLKTLFAVGGWENSQYFSSIASDPAKRLRFISSTLQIVDQYGFDGVDIDWEHPVTGGATEGIPEDKQNYVQLMKELRQSFDEHQSKTGRSEKYLISFAGAAGQWTLDPGLDLPNLLKYADFANVMTYDYFGAWASKWGAYTGSPSPLFYGNPKGFSGKVNADWTIKYYTCKSKRPHQINMGVPFYGRYWENVGDPIDPSDGMWRLAQSVGGEFKGGFVPWKEVRESYLSDPGFKQEFHEKAKVPYAFNPTTRVFLGYENPESLSYKVKYAEDYNVGGLMIWAVDQDDRDYTMLTALMKADLCKITDPTKINHRCPPIDEKRWWTPEDGYDKAGMCGKSAPLYKGYYPVCDPDDPGYSCCGDQGYCGSGAEFCECPTCVDYRTNPEKIIEEPIKPTMPVSWYILTDPDGKRGRCGRGIPLLNGKTPICNPDDVNTHCCSSGGYCGASPTFCECDGCVDFKKTPDYVYKEKTWWDWADGEDKFGRCGPSAPKMDGKVVKCNPDSSSHCCAPSGWCGAGSDFCDCVGCVDFTKDPDHVYKDKTWWEYADGEDKFGRCGPSAPKMQGKNAECNPDSTSYCCSSSGWCGSGSEFCDCSECTNFKK